MNMSRRSVRNALAVLAATSSALLVLAACDDHGGPTCDELGEACHESTSEAGIACHEFVEDAEVTEAECQEKRDECLAACP